MLEQFSANGGLLNPDQAELKRFKLEIVVPGLSHNCEHVTYEIGIEKQAQALVLIVFRIHLLIVCFTYGSMFLI